MTQSEFKELLKIKREFKALECFNKLEIKNNELIVFDNDDAIHISGLSRMLMNECEYGNLTNGFVVKFDAEPVKMQEAINDFLNK
jgi:hypothetical protein